MTWVWPRTSLNSGTPVILMGKLLNSISPRAMDCCAAALLPLAVAQLVYRVNALGSNPVPELIPAEKGWVERNTGPPFAPCAVRSPARLSTAWAVNSEDSRFTICCNWASVGGPLGWVWTRVASRAWVFRSGSRPSHMMPLRNFRLVEGSGRRYSAGRVAVVSGHA